MRRLLVLLAAVAAVLVVMAAPVVAGEDMLQVDLPGDSQGFTHELDAPVLQVGGLAPGATRSTTIQVRNSSTSDARLDLSTSDVADTENGCLRPESRDPGEDCASDEGELSQWLQVTVSRGQAGPPLWSGAFSELSAGVTLTESLPAGATWPLQIAVSLPSEATNATMSDQVAFGTRLSAESQGGRSEVAGPVGTVGGASPHRAVDSTPGSQVVEALVAGPRVGLPMTGASISLWALLLDLAAVLGGLCLVVLSVSRKRGVRARVLRPRRGPGPAPARRTHAPPPSPLAPPRHP